MKPTKNGENDLLAGHVWRSELKGDYKLLSESISDVLWSIDDSLKYTWISHSVQKKRGYSPEEMIGADLKRFLAPGQFDAFKKFLEALPEKNQDKPPAGTFLAELKTKNGVLWGEVHAIKLFDRSGNLAGYAGVTREVKKNDSTGLRFAENYDDLKLIAENVTDVIAVFDMDFKCKYISPSVTGLTGYPVEKFIGARLEGLVTERSRKTLGAEIMKKHKTLTDGGGIGIQLDFIRVDNTIRMTDTEINIVFDGEKEPKSIIMVSRDVHEKRLLEEHLMRTQKMEAVGQLASGVSHEFNNLFAIAMMSIETAELNGTIDAYKSMARTVLNTCKEAADISRRLHEFAESSGFELGPVDLSRCIDNTVELMRKQCAKKQIRIKTVYKARPMLMLNAKLLEQVLYNLIKNAEQSIGKNGMITVSICGNKDNYEVKVSDTGAGIKEENIGRIFDPFYTTKGAFGDGRDCGVGLGLSVSYRIMQMFRGRISVVNLPSGGVELTLIFPKKKTLSTAAKPECGKKQQKVLADAYSQHSVPSISKYRPVMPSI